MGPKYIDLFGGATAVHQRMTEAIAQALSNLSIDNLNALSHAIDLPRDTLDAIIEGRHSVALREFERLAPPLGISIITVLGEPVISNSQRSRIIKDMRNAPISLSAPVSPPSEHNFTPDLYAMLRALHETAWEDYHETKGEPDSLLFADFDVDRVILGHTFVEVTRSLNKGLVKFCLEDPQRMRQLAWRELEEMVAELLSGLGFRVELTAKTRDRGRDIIAVRHDIVAVRFLVECKQPRTMRPIGVGAVRALHGVVQDERSTKGIIATTTFFSPDAKDFLDRNQWVLEGKDYSGLMEWLRQYETMRKGDRHK